MTIDFAREHLTLTRGFLRHIDTAILVLVGFEVAMLGYLATSLPPWNEADVVAKVSAGATIVAVGFSLAALYRGAFADVQISGRSLIDFNDIAERSRLQFDTEYKQADDSVMLEDFTGQIWRFSEILTLKHEAFRLAFIFFLIALPPWMLALGLLAKVVEE